jgi:hypothetical protein
VLFTAHRVRTRAAADSVSAESEAEAGAAAAAGPPSLLAELTRSRLTWGERNDTPADKMFLYLNDTPDTLAYELWADSHFVSPADMAALLRRIEAVLVDAVLVDAAVGVPAMDAVR